MIGLTVPELRRLLLLLAEPSDRFDLRLAWSGWRRHHQAVARRCHAARRSRRRSERQGPAIVRDVPVDIERGLLGGDLSDDGWGRVASLLPAQKPAVGRPATDHRKVLSGILWVQRTGRSWRELPERSGPWQTAYTRYRRWRETGLWQRIVEALQEPETDNPRAPT